MNSFSSPPATFKSNGTITDCNNASDGWSSLTLNTVTHGPNDNNTTSNGTGLLYQFTIGSVKHQRCIDMTRGANYERIYSGTAWTVWYGDVSGWADTNERWTMPTLGSKWEAWDNSYGYRMVGRRVDICLYIKNKAGVGANIGDNIFTIPAGYRKHSGSGLGYANLTVNFDDYTVGTGLCANLEVADASGGTAGIVRLSNYPGACVFADRLRIEGSYYVSTSNRE